MIKVLKASAGSGKTYNLAREYIRLILQSDKADAYRHVLAVTFTNKATDEMKRRILKELNTLAATPQASPYYRDFVPALFQDAEGLQKRARQQLTGILHDYSAFAVSTIDRFFQQTLRAFSREIGQFSSYQVQLDRDALVTESVDRVLDTLSEQDKTLLAWLTDGVKEELQQSGTFYLDKRLQTVAKSLQDLPAEKAVFPREYLGRLQKVCKGIFKDFETKVSETSEACLKVFEEEGISPAESYSGFFKALYKYRNPSGTVAKPTDSFLRRSRNSALWFSKVKDALRLRLEGLLEEPLGRFLDLFEGPAYKEYVTAKTIFRQLYALGVAQDLRDAFAQIQKEKNVLSIDDSNTILHNIIDGTDAPFIYEKLGVRYEDFLLDEFQDTADIQWENFRPLLYNSESTGNDSLVVGDVKQSIYRWRGSDWNLLGSRLEQEFRGVRPSVLDGNYRTTREIVGFNNAFFAFAAAELDRQGGEDPATPGSISDLYRDVEQKVCFPDPEPGSVEVCFTEDQLGEILDTLQDVRSRVGRWEDVAILVRSNDEGAEVASRLVAENIPVVSDDSLFIKSSVTVRRLVSQLSLADAPLKEGESSVASYLAASMEVKIPEHYHSLIDLAEAFLRDIRVSDPSIFDAEIPYIQSFMDYLQDWVSTGGNNLSAFLRNWDDANPKISSPETGDSARVMTIHKAKGLEFPFVIVPFAEKITLYKASSYWCSPAVEGTGLEEASGYFHVSLDSSAADSLFEADYRREQKLEAIDNINVLYVAFTRAKYGLKVIAAPLPASAGEEYKNMSQLLYRYVGTAHYAIGTPYPFDRIERKEREEKPLLSTYESYPAESGNRLKFSPEAADYFGEDGSFGPHSSRRIRGNVLHGILSRMASAEDLSSAVEAAVGSGELPSSDRAETEAFLSERIASMQSMGWFSPGVRVFREVPILSPDGHEYRPDRVVVHPDGRVTVIDYKFGEKRDSYKKQVERYVGLFRKMGYGKVEGYLWYLDDNFTIFVTG